MLRTRHIDLAAAPGFLERHLGQLCLLLFGLLFLLFHLLFVFLLFQLTPARAVHLLTLLGWGEGKQITKQPPHRVSTA